MLKAIQERAEEFDSSWNSVSELHVCSLVARIALILASLGRYDSTLISYHSFCQLQVAETQKIREKYEEEVNREIKKLQVRIQDLNFVFRVCQYDVTATFRF